jgi:hypothetical protein
MTDSMPSGQEREKRLLTVELVPSTCWFSNVRSEVSKEDWDRLRTATYKKAGYRCEICGGRGRRWPVEAHEIWHYDDATHTQTLLGLQSLCPDCHQVKHIGLSEARGRRDEALRHLARVNGWSIEDAEMYVEVQFEVWSRRSQHRWKLDISWLEQFGIDVSRHARRETESG